MGKSRKPEAPPKVEPQRLSAIIRKLKKQYPDAHCTLDFTSPLELLVATILAAQCTDERVNIVTKDLFKKYPTAKDYAAADLKELEQDIRSTGFFRNKAKSLKACCAQLGEKHGGKVPDNMDDLVALPGVGRKTANVILGNAFGTPGVVVDTHVSRLAQRIGLTTHTKQQAEKIEQDLMAIVPKKDWTLFSHLLVFHGRSICVGGKPWCSRCVIRPECDYTGPAR